VRVRGRGRGRASGRARGRVRVRARVRVGVRVRVRATFLPRLKMERPLPFLPPASLVPAAAAPAL
jgi:hypothetical protein